MSLWRESLNVIDCNILMREILANAQNYSAKRLVCSLECYSGSDIADRMDFYAALKLADITLKRRNSILCPGGQYAESPEEALLKVAKDVAKNAKFLYGGKTIIEISPPNPQDILSKEKLCDAVKNGDNIPPPPIKYKVHRFPFPADDEN